LDERTLRMTDNRQYKWGRLFGHPGPGRCLASIPVFEPYYVLLADRVSGLDFDQVQRGV